MIALDTARWIWRASDPKRLTTRARRAIDGAQLAPLDPAIAVRSTKLPGEFHADPADRIIVATALEKAVPIVTPDERIRS